MTLLLQTFLDYSRSNNIVIYILMMSYKMLYLIYSKFIFYIVILNTELHLLNTIKKQNSF